MLEYNLAFARFINWPDTIKIVGLLGNDFGCIQSRLESIEGKVFGDAYIVSTCGRRMPKAAYMGQILLPAVYEALGAGSNWRALHGQGTLQLAYKSLVGIFGVSDFMAGQIIADLKNTRGHPLAMAPDWQDWCVSGPGSKRGMSWLLYGDSNYPVSERLFQEHMQNIRVHHNVNFLHAQDLQNCLCEFDKYCRVLTGTGRSKRSYPGA